TERLIVARGDHERVILDRARAEQGFAAAPDREEKQFHALQCQRPPRLRKLHVPAHEDTDASKIRLEKRVAVARREPRLPLFARQMRLAIAPRDLAGAVDQYRGV